MLAGCLRCLLRNLVLLETVCISSLLSLCCRIHRNCSFVRSSLHVHVSSTVVVCCPRPKRWPWSNTTSSANRAATCSGSRTTDNDSGQISSCCYHDFVCSRVFLLSLCRCSVVSISLELLFVSCISHRNLCVGVSFCSCAVICRCCRCAKENIAFFSLFMLELCRSVDATRERRHFGLARLVNTRSLPLSLPPSPLSSPLSLSTPSSHFLILQLAHSREWSPGCNLAPRKVIDPKGTPRILFRATRAIRYVSVSCLRFARLRLFSCLFEHALLVVICLCVVCVALERSYATITAIEAAKHAKTVLGSTQPES